MAEKPTENTRGSTRSNRPTQRSSQPENNASDAVADPSREAPPPNQTTPSLASRVQNSAAELARSAFQAPSTTELAQTVASGTNGKAAGPSSTNTHSAASADVLTSGRAGQGHVAPSSETFRSATRTQGGVILPALTEEEFQHNYAGSENLGLRGSNDALQSETGYWKGKQRAQDPVQRDYDTVWRRAEPAPTSPAEFASTESDGVAVVSLLGDAAFDPSFATLHTGEEEVVVDLDSPATLSAAEIETLDFFRRSLPHDPTLQPPSQQQQKQRLTSKSLIPDIDSIMEKDPQFADVITELQDMEVLDSLPGARDWLDVQESYHDEVWGYLRPLMEAAKDEIGEKRRGEEEEEDGPAVRRLKMVLTHMKS